MSERAYALAVRDHLRTTMDLRDSECDVCDSILPAITGKRYFAVVLASNVSLNDVDYGVHEETGIDVVITLRASWVPMDRRGQELLIKELSGLEPLARQVAYSTPIHFNYALMNAANAIINDDTEDLPGFYCPLLCVDLGKAEIADGTEFGANIDQAAGVRRTVRFGRARRMQRIEDMT